MLGIYLFIYYFKMAADKSCIVDVTVEYFQK